MDMQRTDVAQRWATDEQGIAMLSVIMVMLLMTVLGFGALTMTGLENRVAGFASSMEASTTAAEACVQTGVKVIQQSLDAPEGVTTVPTTLFDNQTPPGPVPLTNKAQLESEIEGTGAFVPDVPLGPPYPSGVTAAVPNLVQTVGSYSVVGDIDFLYRKHRPGAPNAQGFAYHQAGGTGPGIDLYYRVDCVATNVATGIRSRIAAVYACMLTEGCQRV